MDKSALDATFILWRTELERAIKRDEKWHKRGRKIIRRYRDDRIHSSEGVASNRRKFNILWSNVQTLLPSLYARMPKPIVERRFLDKDPVGRVASTILERTIEYELEDNGYHEAIQAAVLDYLLPGRGQVWVRFEAPAASEQDADDKALSPEQEGGSPYDDEGNWRDEKAGEGYQAKDTSSREGDVAGIGHNGGPSLEDVFECVPVDYVNWEDFLTSQGRVWSEVTWVSRRVWMGRAALRGKWPSIADKIPLDRPRDASGRFIQSGEGEEIRKAEIFEIWCKETKEVHFIAKNWDRMIETVSDPLHLKNFWPCPRPIRATTTNDTLEPVPDYAEYQDQAEALDELSTRISSLTRSLKVAGVYDASAAGLQRLLDEGTENKLIPINSWAAFAEKGGIDGSISWLPIKDIAAVLSQLNEAFEVVLKRLFELTGISDIIRGQSDPQETLGAQKIKGGFATQRLSARQVEVARFARDTIRIVAEIIAEHWSPQTLVLASSILQDDGLVAIPDSSGAPVQSGGASPPQLPAPPNPGTLPTGPAPSPPMAGGSGAMVPTGGPPGTNAALPPPLPPDPQTIKLQMIGQAIQLLRSQKTRGFRIDIETDSTISNDAQGEKQSRVELVTAMSGFLQQAVAGVESFPPSLELAAETLQWVLRGFRVGRDLEAAVDSFIDKAKAFAAQSAQNQGQKPEDAADQAKAQAEIQKAQIDGQTAQIKAQAEVQKAQMQASQEAAEARADQAMKAMELRIAMLEHGLRSAQAERDEKFAQADHQRRMTELRERPKNGGGET